MYIIYLYLSIVDRCILSISIYRLRILLHHVQYMMLGWGRIPLLLLRTSVGAC